MTTPIAAGGLRQLPAAQDTMSQSTQNLFEYVASQAKTLPAGAGPAQLGEQVLKNLEGFFARTSSFADRASSLTQRDPKAVGGGELISVGSNGVGMSDLSQTRNAAGPVNHDQLEMVIQSLGMMFDHSIETQLVVRGATQVSGAANTLVRGQ